MVWIGNTGEQTGCGTYSAFHEISVKKWTGKNRIRNRNSQYWWAGLQCCRLSLPWHSDPRRGPGGCWLLLLPAASAEKLHTCCGLPKQDDLVRFKSKSFKTVTTSVADPYDFFRIRIRPFSFLRIRIRFQIQFRIRILVFKNRSIDNSTRHRKISTGISVPVICDTSVPGSQRIKAIISSTQEGNTKKDHEKKDNKKKYHSRIRKNHTDPGGSGSATLVTTGEKRGISPPGTAD